MILVVILMYVALVTLEGNQGSVVDCVLSSYS